MRVPGSEVVEFTGHPFVLLSAGGRVGVTAVDMRASTTAPGAPTLSQPSPFAGPVTAAATGRGGGGELLAVASGAQVLLFDPRQLAAPLLAWHSLFLGPCTALTMHCAAGWQPAPAHSGGEVMHGGAVLLGSSRTSAAVHAYPFEAMMAPPPGTGGPAALMWDPGARALGLPHRVPSAECRVGRPWYHDRLSAHGLLRGNEDGERGLDGHAMVALGGVGGPAAGGLVLCSQDRRGSVLVEEYCGVLEELDSAAGPGVVPPEKTFGTLPSQAHPAWAPNPEHVRALPFTLHSAALSQSRPSWLAVPMRPTSAPLGDRPARSAVTLAFEGGLEGRALTTSGPADQRTMGTATARLPASGVAPLGGLEGDILDAARSLVVAPAALRQVPPPGPGGGRRGASLRLSRRRGGEEGRHRAVRGLCTSRSRRPWGGQQLSAPDRPRSRAPSARPRSRAPAQSRRPSPRRAAGPARPRRSA